MIELSAAPLAMVAERIVAGGETVFTMNIAHMRMLESDDKFHQAYKGATLVTLDSQALNVLIFKSKRQPVPGSSLLKHLVEHNLLAHRRVVFIGNTEENLVRTVFRSSEVFFFKPSMGFYLKQKELADLLTQVAHSLPDIVFLCVGAPQSEILSARFREAIGSQPSIVCCGAALEFVVGKKSRAPEFLQRIGMEWAWRLASEPRRLFSRYRDDFQYLISARPTMSGPNEFRTRRRSYRFAERK